MYPGRVSKLSETTIPSAPSLRVYGELVRVTGTAAIVNLDVAGSAGFSAVLFVIPLGIFTWTTAGNIALAGTAVVGRLLTFAFSKSTGKWYPSYIS